MRPPPGAQALSARSDDSIEPPTATKPSACASRIRRDQSGAGTAPVTMCATATASSSTSGSSCAASAACRLLVGTTADDDGEPPLVDQRQDLRIQLERVRADLGEPEAKLLDEVEGEPVPARRLRRADEQFDLHLVARQDGAAEVDARAVPDDRVATVVEPVVGELDAELAALPPRRRAGVLQHHLGDGLGTGAELRQPVSEPTDRERAGGDGVLADSFHAAASLLRR